MALFPLSNLRCPKCSRFMDKNQNPAWGPVLVVHLLQTHGLFSATQHYCSSCGSTTASNSAEVLEQLPRDVQNAWSFICSRKNLCDPPLLDLIRAEATRGNGWASCAAAINEMKATHWARTIGSRYRLVCHSLGLEPLSRHQLPQ